MTYIIVPILLPFRSNCTIKGNFNRKKNYQTLYIIKRVIYTQVKVRKFI